MDSDRDGFANLLSLGCCGQAGLSAEGWLGWLDVPLFQLRGQKSTFAGSATSGPGLNHFLHVHLKIDIDHEKRGKFLRFWVFEKFLEFDSSFLATCFFIHSLIAHSTTHTTTKQNRWF